MNFLHLIGEFLTGVGEWVITLLEKTPSFTAMYLFTMYHVQGEVFELMASDWCDAVMNEGVKSSIPNCGGGLIGFAFMAFVVLCILVAVDYNRLT